MIQSCLLARGRYVARLAETRADLAAARDLRTRAFGTAVPDADAFDRVCDHVLIDETGGGAPVATFRMLTLDGGHEIPRSYAAQVYDLAALERYPGRMVEMGRFCVAPERRDPDILRVAWGAMTVLVDRNAVRMLFGCASFAGTRTEDYRDSFALLARRHLAPPLWSPRVKAPEVHRYAAQDGPAPDAKRAMARMPPLLRTYLAMGGWVSDHAVVDRQMNTLHVFTGLEIAAIPPARQRLLRAVAGG